MNVRAGRAIAAVFGSAAIALALTACGAGTSDAAPTPTSIPEISPTPAPTAAVDVPVTSATPPPVREAVAPVTVAVPATGIEVPVIPVAVDPGGFMELPEDPAVAGWYRFGSDPTSTVGNTVISAHVDAPDYPIGPFSTLRDLGAGERVVVTDAAGAAHEYAVTSVEYHRKTSLPVEQIFARTGAPTLILITCGGEYDPAVGRYAENVVVTAVPA